MKDIVAQFIPVGYRRVEIGEVIKTGDLYWSTTKTWQDFPLPGAAAQNPEVVIITKEEGK